MLFAETLSGFIWLMAEKLNLIKKTQHNEYISIHSSKDFLSTRFEHGWSQGGRKEVKDKVQGHWIRLAARAGE
jgi:hypothetical protein